MEQANHTAPVCSPRAEFPAPGTALCPQSRPSWARVGHVLGLLPVLQCRRPSGARVDRLRHSAGYAEP